MIILCLSHLIWKYGTLMNWVGKTWCFVKYQGFYWWIIDTSEAIIRQMSWVLFFKWIFRMFEHIFLENLFVMGNGFFQQRGKKIMFDFLMFLSSKYMPLIKPEMIVVKLLKRTLEFFLIIEQKLKTLALLKGELERWAFDDFVPVLLFEGLRESLPYHYILTEWSLRDLDTGFMEGPVALT